MRASLENTGMYIYFIYLLFLAVVGLSCSTRDLSLRRADTSLQHAGFSLVVACTFSLSSCGARVPECVGSVVCSTWAV